MNKSTYIDIDSTYRDTLLFPEPHSFKIPLGRVKRYFNNPVTFWKGRSELIVTIGGVPSAIKVISNIAAERVFKGQYITYNNQDSMVVGTSNDGTIYLETPFTDFDITSSFTATIKNTSNEKSVTMFTDNNVYDNMFKRQYITNLTKGETREICSFSSKNMKCELSLPFSNIDYSDAFCITKQKPLFVGLFSTIDGNNLIERDAESHYISVNQTKPEWVNQYINIMGFFGGNGDTKFELTPEIIKVEQNKIRFHLNSIQLMNDNQRIYFIITKKDEYFIQRLDFKPDKSKIYNVKLLHLILPNLNLGSMYSHVYVELFNKHVIHSNNSNRYKSTFRCSFNDVNVLNFTSFIKLGCKMSIPLQLDDDIMFKVYLPDGKPYSQDNDSSYPNKPDPLKQISCCLEIQEY